MPPAAGRPRRSVIRARALGIRLALGLGLAALLAGCGATTGAALQAPRTSATPTSTRIVLPTPIPTPALTVLQATGAPVAGLAPSWQHASLPVGFGMAWHQSDLQVSASDGTTAYSCGVPSGAARPQVIVTHDGGASWTRVADVPNGWTECDAIGVDALDPSIVIASGGPPTSGEQQAVSVDGGATWRLTSATPQYSIVATATRGSRTYALLASSANNSVRLSLGVSDDHLRTWRAIDTTLNTSDYRTFWLNPTNGALLVESWPGGGAFQLWSSTDDGAHWSQILAPMANAGEFVARQPETAASWHVCGVVPAAGSSPVGSFVCTSDGGRTWAQEPLLVPGGAASYGESIAALPADGSLLAEVTEAGGSALYRLPAGETRWQALGRAPSGSDGGATYAPTGSGGGLLWTFPAESDGASTPDSPTDVYSAAYPY